MKFKFSYSSQIKLPALALLLLVALFWLWVLGKAWPRNQGRPLNFTTPSPQLRYRQVTLSEGTVETIDSTDQWQHFFNSAPPDFEKQKAVLVMLPRSQAEAIEIEKVNETKTETRVTGSRVRAGQDCGRLESDQPTIAVILTSRFSQPVKVNLKEVIKNCTQQEQGLGKLGL